MYFLNLIVVFGFIYLQIGCVVPNNSHASGSDVQHDIPYGSQSLCISYFNKDSGKYCSIPYLPPQECLYYGKYFVNVMKRTFQNSMATIDSITHQSITTDSIYYQVECYDLINLEKRKYTRYTSFSKSAIKSKEGTISKSVNLNDFEDYSSTMSVVADLNDSIIDHKNFKRVLLKSDTSAVQYIAYFQPIKVQSPLQISNILNTKYNATLLRLDLLYQNGDKAAIEMQYKPGDLTEEQKAVIAQWIKNEN